MNSCFSSSSLSSLPAQSCQWTHSCWVTCPCSCWSRDCPWTHCPSWHCSCCCLGTWTWTWTWCWRCHCWVWQDCWWCHCWEYQQTDCWQCSAHSFPGLCWDQVSLSSWALWSWSWCWLTSPSSPPPWSWSPGLCSGSLTSLCSLSSRVPCSWRQCYCLCSWTHQSSSWELWLWCWCRFSPWEAALSHCRNWSLVHWEPGTGRRKHSALWSVSQSQNHWRWVEQEQEQVQQEWFWSSVSLSCSPPLSHWRPALPDSTTGERSSSFTGHWSRLFIMW